MKIKIIGMAVVILSALIALYIATSEEPSLGIISPVDLNEKLVDPSLQSKMSGHRIGSFELTDENNEVFNEERFEGKIYVADFFFTTCPGICKAMAKQMIRVQDDIKDMNDVLILSHTVQPEVDTPEILKNYAELQGAISGKWIFATGEKQMIFDLARKTYFAAALDPENPDAMVHTENFVLVDKEKRIRGIYDGTSEEEVDELINDIRILRKEYE